MRRWLGIKIGEALIEQILKTATVLPGDTGSPEEMSAAMSLRRQARGQPEPASEKLPRVITPPK